MYNETQYLYTATLGLIGIPALTDINILYPKKYSNIRSFYMLYIMNLYKKK